MSLWSRLINVFRADALRREIDEEFEGHIADAIVGGADPSEARRAFGPPTSRLEASRDLRLIPWLDSVRGDTVFAWRQLNKHKVTSAAAILSIGLAIGACTSAFRLVDALLLRPLPVEHPERLFVLSQEVTRPSDQVRFTNDSFAYPEFRQLRSLVKDQAELIAVSYTARVDLTYATDQEIEKANQQYVSGWMFSALGLQPALGRVLTEQDDQNPGAHPYAVISYDYWQSRFAGDPNVVGRTFRTGIETYQIVGVVQKPFTGTETGVVTDIFIPTMMVKNRGIERADYKWFRTFVMLRPGVAPQPVHDRLDAALSASLQEALGKSKSAEAQFSLQNLMNPASSGVSHLQAEYGRSLSVLSLLVALVLAIACSNVANLMAVHAAARSREMALRISIGAGRRRLLQMILLESALLSCIATAAGALFAWWSAPFIVNLISSPVAPTRLNLAADWRVLAFSAAVALGVALLLSLPTVFQVSALTPASALKGGVAKSRGRLMHSLIAIQAGFCFLVLFIGTLFVTTFERLSSQPTGFSSERIVTLETLSTKPVKTVVWEQTADRLRAMPGVEAVALSEWPLMTGESWNNLIAVPGAPLTQVPSQFLSTSSGWREVMRIPLVAGRDFRANGELPGSAIVNNAFVKAYFGGDDPIGKSFDMVTFGGGHTRFQVVGRVADARYRNMREPMGPVAYFPFNKDYARASFIVRTASRDPLAIAPALRREISARPDLHVSNIRTQNELNESHMVRERLLAMLALFFGAVALLLAGVGLYGLLDYSVLQRRREIGIRMAIGASSGGLAARIAGQALGLVLVGVLAGLALGVTTAGYVESLLYGVKANDFGMLALPGATIVLVAFISALPAVIRTARIDAAAILRSE